jgi:hypothetical protein
MPSSALRSMAHDETTGDHPHSIYLKFYFGFNLALLNGWEPTKAELVAKLKEEATLYKDDPFLSAFLFCAAEHVEIEPGIDNKGDGPIAAPYVPSYNECISKCDINWI